MKKMCAMLGAALLLMMLMSCNEMGDEGVVPPSDDLTQQNTGDTDNKESAPVAVSMEALMAHAVTPAEEFTFAENATGGLVVKKYTGSDPIVVIPDEHNGLPVQEIGKYAFSADSPVCAIKLPDSVTTIRESAFGVNDSLQIVVCGKNLESIEKSAFLLCRNLTSVQLNEGLVSVGEAAFSDCASLSEVSLPDSVTEIGVAAFFSCHPDLVLHGKAGSCVEAYATKEDIKFEAN